ncbi:unnamed protein product [Pylaiella littoralis]
MHAAAALSHAGGVLKYALPVSDTSCLVTHRIFVCFTLLFDASLVTFLLAKVHVTTGGGNLRLWERGIVWLTRAYAWVYLPVAIIGLGLGFPGVANSEGTFCYNGFASGEDDAGTSENARSFAMHNSILVVQLVLLLGVFLKPMLVPAEGTQSGGAIYKRVVVRNVVCTACIVTAYVIMTAVAVLALLNETADNNQAAQVRDMAIAVNQLVVLCLTEVSLPLGFASCCKAIGTVRKQEGQASRPVNGAADAVTKTKVIPVEVLPPQIP